MISNIDSELEFTGERMVPGKTAPRTFWDHIYRYRFACGFVKDRTVIDVACGEGYGAHAISVAGAAKVIGIDVDEPACDYAHRKYGIETMCRNAIDTGLPPSSVDVVVSYETIEHIEEVDAFVRESARILKPGGTFIVSTPNREVYSEHGHHNDFHCSEMNRDEFQTVLTRCFKKVRMYSQGPKSAPWWHHGSLSAIESPWLHMKGFWRFRSMFLPHHSGDVSQAIPPTSQQCQDIAGTILEQDGFMSRIMNPFEVRRMSDSVLDQPRFLIAVCKTPG